MYENTTYESILERMLARVPDKLDKREGSVIWDTHSPTAIELQILYMELDSILQEAYGDSASREFLIRRCRERGIYPYPATHAIGRGVFVPVDIDVSGQRFNIGEINYTVLEKMADGEYQVQCESPGIVGNQYLGTMVPMEYIKGLQSAELTEILIPGEKEEETEALRKRYFASFDESAFGGNVRDYLEKTNAIPGVGGTKVTRVWNSDLSPSKLFPKESVEIWYNAAKETLTGEVRNWLDNVFLAAKEKKLTTGGTVLLTIINSEFEAASDALVQNVQTVMDPEENGGEGYGLAPIGHVVKVKSARTKEVSVRTTLTFEPGYSWENLQKSLEQAVSAYLLELRKEWADAPYLVVRVSQINNRLLSVSGILDVQNTTVNASESNVKLEKDEIPVLGGIGQ